MTPNKVLPTGLRNVLISSIGSVFSFLFILLNPSCEITGVDFMDFFNGLLGGGIFRIIPDFLFAVELGLKIYLLATKNKQEDSGKKGKRK